MKKTIKYGLFVAFIHVVIVFISDYLFGEILGQKYEAYAAAFGLIAFPDVLPLLFIANIFDLKYSYPNISYFLFIYLFGSLFYFLIGWLI